MVNTTLIFETLPSSLSTFCLFISSTVCLASLYIAFFVLFYGVRTLSLHNIFANTINHHRMNHCPSRTYFPIQGMHILKRNTSTLAKWQIKHYITDLSLSCCRDGMLSVMLLLCSHITLLSSTRLTESNKKR